MANRASTTLRLVVFFGLAAVTMTGSLAGPAYADYHDDRNQQWNRSRQEHAHQQVQHHHVDPGQPQLGRQHQAGRSRARDHHVRVHVASLTLFNERR